MKIAIMGYSGSGKSTLCRKLAQKYHLPALHLDQVEYLSGWKERPADEQQNLVSDFLDSHPDGWVIDGNYSALSFERRTEAADFIILMLFGRLNCLFRCLLRYCAYHGASRPDMTEGCIEKLDWEFVRWILWEGRTKQHRERYQALQKNYPSKIVILKNQRQIDHYLKM